MRNYMIALLAAVLSLTSCQDDEGTNTPSTNVTLNLKATYDGAPLVLYQPLTYADGHKIMFQKFNFFISNITLLGINGTPNHVLSEVEYFDFVNNLDAASASQPISTSFENVPVGDYEGISMEFGVAADMNNEDAEKLPSDHPLRQHFASHYWSDWGSFIFMISEGIYDLNNDGELNQLDQGFEHHPGMNDVLKSVTLSKSFTLQADQGFDLDFSADIYKIYVDNGVALDLSDPNNKDTQSLSDLPLAIDLMSHWENAIQFEN